MLGQLSKNWWVLVVRGLLAILFGILVFLSPGITLEVLITFLGAYLLVDGIAAIITAVRGRATSDRWWVLLLEGLMGIIAGILTFVWPQITVFVVLYLVAAWAITTGIFEIIAAIRLRNEMEGEFFLGLSGLLSVIFGILLVIAPGAGILTLLGLLGGYSIVFGVLLLVLGFRLRNAGAPPVSTTA